MLIKIGEAYFDEACIAAIAPKGIGGDTFAVFLTTGQTVHTDACREEIEAAVESLGFFSYDNPEPVFELNTAPKLNAAEMLELMDAQDCGMEWIARDKDGHVKAFSAKPILQGAYWYDSAEDWNVRRLHEDYGFLVWEEDGAMKIADLLH